MLPEHINKKLIGLNHAQRLQVLRTLPNDELADATGYWLSNCRPGSDATYDHTLQTLLVPELIKRVRSSGLEWRTMDDPDLPLDGTVVIVMGRYPQATAGFPRFAQFDSKNGYWRSVAGLPRTLGGKIIVWAWMHRNLLPSWPVEPPHSRLIRE